jgi:hypothetical protein
VRTLFGTFKLGCWIYTALSIIITLIVLAIVAKHAPVTTTPATTPSFPW